MITRDQIRQLISSVCDGAGEAASAIGTDLQRDDEGWIVDDSDLGIAIRELEQIEWILSKLSFQLVCQGIEAAPPIDPMD